MIENLSDLKYFIEIAQTGNMTRASERLGVTQPSLSLALQRLEEKVGATLIERSQKGSHLTRQGQALLVASKRMLQEWERETRMIVQGQETPIGKYVIGLHSTVAQYTLDKFIPSMLNLFGDIEFDFIHDLSRIMTERVISRECDLALVMNPVAHPDLVLTKLLSDEITLFKHPQYKGDTLLSDPSLKQTQDLLKSIRKTFPFKREVHSSSLEVLRLLAANKAGAALLPKRVAEIAPELKMVSGSPVFKDELYLAYRVERKKEESFKKIIGMIKESF